MSKPNEELKTVMITCYKCSWSFSSNKKECPMCGANIVINEKELVRILGEYIERQGMYSTKKECENFIKKFKKSKKQLPTLEDLWNAAVDFVKLEEKGIKEKEKKKKDTKKSLDLKAQMEKLKKKKIQEQKNIKTKDQKEPITSTELSSNPEPLIKDKDKRLREIQEKRESLISSFKESTEEVGYKICPTCGTKNSPSSKFCLEDGTPLE